MPTFGTSVSTSAPTSTETYDPHKFPHWKVGQVDVLCTVYDKKGSFEWPSTLLVLPRRSLRVHVSLTFLTPQVYAAIKFIAIAALVTAISVAVVAFVFSLPRSRRRPSSRRLTSSLLSLLPASSFQPSETHASAFSASLESKPCSLCSCSFSGQVSSSPSFVASSFAASSFVSTDRSFPFSSQSSRALPPRKPSSSGSARASLESVGSLVSSSLSELRADGLLCLAFDHAFDPAPLLLRFAWLGAISSLLLAAGFLVLATTEHSRGNKKVSRVERTKKTRRN